MPTLKITVAERCEILYALNRRILENSKEIKTLSKDYPMESKEYPTGSDLIIALTLQNQRAESAYEKIKKLRTVG